MRSRLATDQPLHCMKKIEPSLTVRKSSAPRAGTENLIRPKPPEVSLRALECHRHTMVNIETRPCVVTALEKFDYPIRVAALRLMGSGDGIDAVLDDVMADRELLREVVKLLSHMAYAGLLEYYGGWDDESAHWTISREHALAEDLSTIEAQLLQTHEGTPELKLKMKAVETEIRAASQSAEARAPGSSISYRPRINAGRRNQPSPVAPRTVPPASRQPPIGCAGIQPLSP
jgi:hypothetical protein